MIMNDALKKIQKETGIKMGKYDNDKNRIYHTCKSYLVMLDLLYKDIEQNNLTNEQWFLDFADTLNEYSVKY